MHARSWCLASFHCLYLLWLCVCFSRHAGDRDGDVMTPMPWVSSCTCTPGCTYRAAAIVTRKEPVCTPGRSEPVHQGLSSSSFRTPGRVCTPAAPLGRRLGWFIVTKIAAGDAPAASALVLVAVASLFSPPRYASWTCTPSTGRYRPAHDRRVVRVLLVDLYTGRSGSACSPSPCHVEESEPLRRSRAAPVHGVEPAYLSYTCPPFVD